MKQTEKTDKRYVWVRDELGTEFLCPLDALKDPKHASDEELENCINVDLLKPHIEL